MNKLALFALAAVTVAGAANADVYVHGKTAGGNGYAKGLTADFSYWGGYNGANASGAKQAYNWDGKSDIVSTSTVAGDFNAKLPAKSVIRCHSAGCLLTARAIHLYGIAKFSRVVAGASAEGGSELWRTCRSWRRRWPGNWASASASCARWAARASSPPTVSSPP